MQQALTTSHFENLELQIKKEQEPLKKSLKPHIMSELRPIVENCFMMPKSKKENFITREKIVLDLLKVFQSQKRFKPSENIYSNVRYLAAYDNADHQIGKIVNLNLIDQTVEFFTHNEWLNKRACRVKSFNEVSLFDYNSMSMEVMFNEYRRNHEYGSLSYLDMYNFLSRKDCNLDRTATQNKNYGVELTKAEESPVIQQIIADYGIPEDEIKKPKKRLFRLDINTLAVLEEFESVKEASEKLGISASTISNVLCQGKSAQKYLEAGNSKWAYSDQPNTKYQMNYQVVSQKSEETLTYTLHQG